MMQLNLEESTEGSWFLRTASQQSALSHFTSSSKPGWKYEATIHWQLLILKTEADSNKMSFRSFLLPLLFACSSPPAPPPPCPNSY